VVVIKECVGHFMYVLGKLLGHSIVMWEGIFWVTVRLRFSEYLVLMKSGWCVLIGGRNELHIVVPVFLRVRMRLERNCARA